MIKLEEFIRSIHATAFGVAVMICATVVISFGANAADAATAPGPNISAARAAFASGNYSEAAKLLEKDDSIDALLIRGQSFLISDLGAVSYLITASSMDPKRVDALCFKVLAELHNKKRDDALRDAKQAMQNAPRDPFAMACLGLAQFQLHNDDAAWPLLKKAAALAPDDLNVNKCLATAYEQDLQPEKSKEIYLRLAKAHPKNPLPHIWLAELSENDGKLPVSVSEYTKVLQLSPNCKYASLMRGKAYARMKEWKKAIDDATTATQNNFFGEMVDKARRLRANSNAELQQYALALPDLDSLLRNIGNPRDVSGSTQRDLLLRVKCHEYLHHYDKALADANLLLRVRPSSTEALVERAQISAAMGKYQSSIEQWNNLIRIDDGVPQWYEARAAVFDKLGKTSEAQKDRGKAKQLLQ